MLSFDSHYDLSPNIQIFLLLLAVSFQVQFREALISHVILREICFSLGPLRYKELIES